MNLCRFNRDHLGVVEGEAVYDVTAALEVLSQGKWPPEPGDRLIAELDKVAEAARRVRPDARAYRLSEVSLHSPVITPTKIMAAPANYRAHIDIDAADPAVHHGVHNRQLEGVERPTETLGLFLKASSALVGPAEGLSLCWRERRNDPEVELVAVIGRTARHVAADRALDYIAGYAVGLDVTVRGTEDRSWRKSADSYAVLGPWLTTADAIADPEKLSIWLDVNGERRQKSSTGLMIVGLRRLIELTSSIYTLYPGDLIYTGTPDGVTAVSPGDILVAGCDGIGSMRVQVR
jgi:2,4-didehydro-3-deoxy-L-rhamnonate hydrolase